MPSLWLLLVRSIVYFVLTDSYSPSPSSVCQEVDRVSSSQTIINKMIIYVDSVCDCGFDTNYLTPLKIACNARIGTLIVSTNLTLPFDHRRGQLINYLENWLKTEPNFTKTIGGGRTIVSVVDFETEYTVYPSPPPPMESGDGTDTEPTDGRTSEIVDGLTKPDDNDSESGSGSSGDNFQSSSPIVAMDIGTIVLTFAAVVILSLS